MRLGELLREDLRVHDKYQGKVASQDPCIRIPLLALNPYFGPVLLIRLAAHLHRRGGVARWMSILASRVNYVIFGIEVARQTSIGPGLYLPHTRGTVIGAAEIGARAIIYHGVTLGARFIDIGFNPETRPVIGSDVLIGAGSVVLGPVMIGDRARVGANAVVTASVDADAVVVAPPPVPLASRADRREGS